METTAGRDKHWLERLSAEDFQISDLPRQVRTVVEASLDERGWDKDPWYVTKVLEDLLRRTLAEEAREEGTPSDEQVQRIAALCLVWAQYLEPILKGQTIRRRGQAKALQFVKEKHRLKGLIPEHLVEPVSNYLSGVSVPQGRAGGSLAKLSRRGREALDALLKHAAVASEVLSLTVPPGRPTPYIHRKSEYEALERGIQGSSGGWAPFVVTGHPGVGKATLVAEYARRMKAAGRYRDGVFWIELGKHPLLIKQIRQLASHLGSALPAGVKTVKEASAWLGEALTDKAVLLVLAEAHSAEDVLPFLVGGEQCRVVVTATPAVATALGLPRERELRLGGLMPEEGIRFVKKMVGSTWQEEDQEIVEEIGERVSWSPYALKHLARAASRGAGWKHLLDQMKRIQVSEPDGAKIQWQKTLEAVHKVWVESIEDAEALLAPWANLPWFSSFDLKLVQAVYGVDEEMAFDRLQVLVDHALIHPVAEEGLAGPRYRWNPLIWDYIRRTMGSKDNASTQWVDRYKGGWGRGPLWRIVVPGQPIRSLQPWRLRRWWIDTKDLGLSGGRRFIPYASVYAVARGRHERVEWPAEVWATWERLARRTTRITRLCVGWFLGWNLLLYLGTENLPLWRIGHVLPAETIVSVFSILYLLVMSPALWLPLANLISNLRMLDRWVYGNRPE